MKKQRKTRPRPTPILSAKARRNTFLRWKRSFEIIRHSIIHLASKRQIYEEVRSIIAANNKIHKPSQFYDWMQEAYVTDMAIGIRKMVDWDKRTVSFVRLLQEIEDHPEVITRRRFVSVYKSFMKTFGHKDFEKFSKPGASMIDRSIIRRHRQSLIKSQKKLRIFVNTHVVHIGRFRMKKLPTFDQLNTALDQLEQLTKTYALLLNQMGLVRVAPTIINDWKAIFRIAWLPESNRT